MELIYTNSGSNDQVITQTELSRFEGKWISAFVRSKYNDGKGYLEVILRDAQSGTTLLSHIDNNIDMFRNNADFNRPKWGIYRDIQDKNNLRDETVLFADFCIAEGSNTCPQ